MEMSFFVNHNNDLMVVREDSRKHPYQEPLQYSPLDKTLASCGSFCLLPVLGDQKGAGSGVFQGVSQAVVGCYMNGPL